MRSRSARRTFRRILALIIATSSIASGLILFSPLFTARAFKPIAFPGANGGDKTHVQITEEAIKELVEGGIIPGVNKVSKRMEKAIEQINKGNAGTDLVAFFSDEPHFTGDRLAGGQARLQALFNNMKSALEANKLDEARWGLGTSLHAIQDFYSHSNWIESGHFSMNPNVANFSSTGDLLASAAFPNEVTCVNCAEPWTCSSCANNVISNRLTTGWFQSLPFVGRKPFGRCSHGGTGDLSRDDPGTGGIGKDTSCDAAPHGHLHQLAASIAKTHTKEFLRYIKRNVTIKQFRALLGVGDTLAFAIDTTGSMSQEIAGVRMGATLMVASRLNTDLEPAKYVLVEIDDPTTNLSETDDPAVFSQSINSLQADDGGDCPELAFTAMAKALEKFDESGGELMVFTDASAKDSALAGTVIALAERNDVNVSLFVSGSCSPIDPEYFRVARETGGQAFVIAETETFEATKLADFTVRPDSVDVAHINGTLSATPATYTVPVDSTLTSVTFSVSGPEGAIVKRPDGSTVQPTDPGVSSANISGGTILSISNPADGSWTVTMSGDGEFTLRVTGESALRFSAFDVVQLAGIPEHEGYFPIDGLPLAGQTNKVSAELSSSDFTAAQFELRTTNGALLQTLALSEIPNFEVGGPKQYLGDVNFPVVPVIPYLTGTDTNGQPFQRVLPKSIEAQTVQISASRMNEIYPGREFSYTAQVTNHGPADAFKIEASDDYRIVRHISPSAFTLNTGESINVTVTVKAVAGVPSGARDVITLSVTSTGASETNNFAVTELMIVPEFEIGPGSTLGGNPSVGTIRLFDGVAFEPGTVVNLSSSDTGVANVPATVTVQPGSRQESFVISTLPVSAVTPVTITASYGTVSHTAVLKVVPVEDTLIAVNLSEGTVQAGTPAKARVTLNGPAPAGGATVTLSSNSAAASVPSSVTIAEGSSEGAFTIDTTSVTAPTTAEITATRNGISQSASLRIYPVAMEGISVSPEHLVGGAAATATIALRDSAPAGGATITLDSGNNSLVSIPAQVTIPAGGFGVNFAVSTSAVTVPTSVAIRATYEGVVSATYVRLTPGVVPTLLDLWPSNLSGGETSTGTVVLNGAAPAGGTIVTLASSDTAVASLPATVTVPAGEDWANFTITTTAVSTFKTITISASVNGVGQTKLLTVEPTSLAALTLLPTSIGAGNTAQGIVTLSNPAPAGGTFISLSSLNTSLATVPETVTVPGGSTSATFPITTLPVALSTGVTIRASYGDRSKSATLVLFGANDVFATITPDGPTVTITTTTAGQNARLVFEGTAGQRVGLIMSGVTISSSAVSILKPDGTNLTTATTIGTSGGFIVSPPLTVSGTYTILVDPGGSAVGNMTLKLIDVPPDITGAIVPGGPPVTVTTVKAGQKALLTFSGTAGQRVSLLVSGVTLTGGSNDLAASIKKPDDTVLASDNFINSSGEFIDVQTLPVTGTYTVAIAPRDTTIGSATLRLYDVPADVTGNIVPGGPPLGVATTVPGQNALLAFNGTAGQRITLNISGVSLVGGNGRFDVAVKKPDGTNLATANFLNSSGGFINTQTLPVTGAYSILVNPQTSTTASATLLLNDVSADVTTTIVPGGPAVTVTTTSVGQNAQLTFDGNADQRISLKITGVAMTGGNGSVDIAIKKPDGTNLATSNSVGASGGFIDTRVLPVTGTYTIFVDPQGMNTGSVTLTLYDVPPDFTSPIAPGGSSVTVTTTVPGQNGQLFFAGLANQRVALKISGKSLTGGSNTLTVAIRKPDGTSLATTFISSATGFIDTQTLPVDGAYSILADPATTSIGSATFTLYAVADDLVGSITPGDPPVTVSTSSVGQNVILSFAGTVNQRVFLRITNVVLTGGTSNRATVAIRKPDGSNLFSTTVDSSGGVIDTKVLPVNGTYTLVVDPNDTATGTVTLTLVDVPPDVSGPIVPGGSAVTVATTTAGQNVQLTFSGVINQRVSLEITNLTVTTGGIVTVAIKNPDGSNLGSTILSTSTGFIDVRTLPATGTYTVLVDPNSFNTTSATLKLYDVPADFATSTTINATAVGVTTTVPGQNASVTFSATSGQQVTVRFTNNAIGLMTVRLFKPDGTQQSTSTSSSTNFNMTTQTLSSTGTFTISIDPNGKNKGTADVRVTSP